MDERTRRALERKRLEIIHTALRLLDVEIKQERKGPTRAPAAIQAVPRRLAVNE
jgi:hypothetical protein